MKTWRSKYLKKLNSLPNNLLKIEISKQISILKKKLKKYHSDDLKNNWYKVKMGGEILKQQRLCKLEQQKNYLN